VSRCQNAIWVVLLGASVTAWGEPRFDHTAFDVLLRAHVAGGLVDYDAFAKSPKFPNYVESLAKADITSLPKAERLAFWINTYNAYMIQLIVSHHERDSIRSINKTLGTGRISAARTRRSGATWRTSIRMGPRSRCPRRSVPACRADYDWTLNSQENAAKRR
jgi:hypothetical protein